MEIKDIKATGEWVVIECVPVSEDTSTTTASGVKLPNGKTINQQKVNTAAGKKAFDFVVKDIGPDAKDKVSYKVGDYVIVNDYDFQAIGDDAGNTYGLTHYKQVKAVITLA